VLPGKLPVKLLKFKDLARVGVNNYPTLKRWQKDQGFPKGRLLGKNTRVWTEEEILAWWDSRAEQPPPENVKGAGAVDAAPDAPEAEASFVTHQHKRNGTGFQRPSKWEGWLMVAAPKRQSVAPEEWCSLESLNETMELHGDALEQMATWREDFTIRIRRAVLKFELIGLDDAEQAALEREADEFNRACKVLGWRPKP
jgi:predicted DNA-binding transcriptional regulator AlpA